MAKKPIFLDYDDTLVDFNAAVLMFVNQWNKINLTHSDILSYGFLPDAYGEEVRTLWQTYGLYKYVKPFETSKMFLKELNKHYEVYIVTKSHLKVQYEKDYHAKFHFGIRDNIIHVDHHKSHYTVNGPLVDDATHNIEEHIITNSQPGILFNMNGQNGWSKPNIQHRLLRIANSHNAALRLLGI